MMPRSQSMELEALAGRLEASGGYRVLRRLAPPPTVTRSPQPGERIALILDLETTGLDVAADEVIEIGMVKVTYDVRTGAVGDVIGTFGAFREPMRPITPEITRLTGIDGSMVAGKSIDLDALEAFISGANLAVGHNAGFDRPIAERHFPIFEKLPWACSVRDVSWSDLGFPSAKLGSLLAEFGLFHDAHRAVDDCLALAELLRRCPPGCAVAVMSLLLSSARRPSLRVWAKDAPFESKNLLKSRGYRWSPSVRSWHADLPPEAEAGELAWLSETIYRSPIVLPVARLCAIDRYSMRAEALPTLLSTDTA